MENTINHSLLNQGFNARFFGGAQGDGILACIFFSKTTKFPNPFKNGEITNRVTCSDIVTRAAWFSGKIRDLLPKGCRFDSHSEKFSLIKEVNVPI